MTKIETIINNLNEEQKIVFNHYYEEGMSIKELYDILDLAWWKANHSGYNDHMAWRLMAGESSSSIDSWEFACKHKYTIYYLCNLLKE